MPPLTDDNKPLGLTPQGLETLLRTIVRDELQQHHVEHCRFNLPEASAEHIGHTMGMLTDLGEGDIAKGIEVSRDNHKFTSTIRGRTEKAASVFIATVITLAVTGLVALVTGGVVTWFKGLK